MTKEAILNQALSLSEMERGQLIDQLLLSLQEDVDPSIEKAIAEEVERRIDAVENGEMKTMSEEEFLGHFESDK